ncbi:MAG TPA: DNA polymerase III subunit beta [Candidatus Marinimicrobia bacterium]|jgi:DNA polymerase-3 subunit beta|nr:DNA polymerase III subunit beta [Candidatus Neomarinimicrobiota bacterium]HIM26762.1 DNA polymerase III subunit beta [Candidatus Neomarinimicrobiota bacterium]|tara:strand:- start:241 stop:1359 length:1119 start_codon:yes stop_codon:yes gene_type:complete
MKYSTSKSELQKALQKVSKATPTRSTIPILSCVLIDVGETGTTLRTTDLEITITTSIESSIEEIGSAAIPLQTLSEITSELPDDTRITIDVNDNNNVKIITDVGSYDLMGKPADEFPANPEADQRVEAGIEANILNEIISTISFAVSRDDLKPALTGVYFKFENENLIAVATDGHRLARYVRKDFKAGQFQGEVIVPRKFLNIITTYIPNDEPIQLWLGDNVFTATIGADTIYTRIIDERFPDYQSVIPTDNEKEIKVSCKNLLSAVKRVSIFSNKSTHQIAIRVESGSATVTTEDPEKASKAQETIEIEYAGDPIDVGYNAAYLKDILSHMNSNEIVIKLNTPISAGLFYPTPPNDNVDVTMLLMPIRLND